MKVTHIIGSPRGKSSSSEIGERFCSTLEERGAKVNSYVLNKMDITGCQGCYGCKQGKGRNCILKDELAPVLDEIVDADFLVFSYPVYVWDIPGQAKLFIDRLTSFLKPGWKNETRPSRLAEGKKALIIQTQGSGEEMFGDVAEKYQRFFLQLMGFSEVLILREGGLADPKRSAGTESIKKAEELGLYVAGADKKR